MKRLILTAVALSFLAMPIANAQPFQNNNSSYTQGHHKDSSWNKKQTRTIVKKKVVQKKQVARPHWAKGKKVPAWQRNQVVRDYHRHGLRKPGHGQHWVKVGNDYLLVSIASGVIAGLLFGR